MKILLADDDCSFLNRLEKHINSIAPDAIIYKADNVHKIFSLTTKEKDFSFIFTNFDMLGKDWRHNLKKLIDGNRSSKLVFVSDSDNQDTVNYLLLSGCYGYIPKNYNDDILSLALSLLFKGCEYIPPSFLHNRQKRMHAPTDYRLPDGRFLTPRQIQVLGLLGEGLSNKQIAYEMDVSEATVKLHINALLKNLDVDNRTQAVVSAQRLGFL